jgi:hypothetical protein
LEAVSMTIALAIPEQLYGQMAKVDDPPPPHYGDRWERLAEVVREWNRTTYQRDPLKPNETVLAYMNDPRTPRPGGAS